MQSRVFDRSLRAQPAAGRPAVQKAARPAPAPAAAAPAAPTAGAGTYVRAPVPKPAKKLPPSKKPTPRKPFVRPCNPYDPMPADTLHCARCHRNYGKGDAHYFCLLPHVFDRDAFVACQTLFARQGGDRAVKAGRIKEVPCIYAACCSDAMLSAQGELYMPVDVHVVGFHTPFVGEVEEEMIALRAQKRVMPQYTKCKTVDGKCARECMKQTKFPDVIFTDEL